MRIALVCVLLGILGGCREQKHGETVRHSIFVTFDGAGERLEPGQALTVPDPDIPTKGMPFGCRILPELSIVTDPPNSNVVVQVLITHRGRRAKLGQVGMRVARGDYVTFVLTSIVGNVYRISYARQCEEL